MRATVVAAASEREWPIVSCQVLVEGGLSAGPLLASLVSPCEGRAGSVFLLVGAPTLAVCPSGMGPFVVRRLSDILSSSRPLLRLPGALQIRP